MEEGLNTAGARLAVLGAGVMGTAISALALGHGLALTLVDVDEEALSCARDRIRTHLRTGALMGAFPPEREPAELTTSGSVHAVLGADAVIEAIVEDAAAKAKVLSEVSGAISPGTPLISNTSAIPIDELADAVSRPEELVGAHFMNPTYLIPTVEVVRGPRSSAATVERVLALLAALRRRPLVVADGPGFVTSRLLHKMINEAIAIVGEGRADAETVDALLEGCAGHRTGPLRTADLIGLDNLADSLRGLHERTGDPAARPAALLLELVARGHLGRKSGRGFYGYGDANS